MLRILIADDEPLARKVLCEELRRHPGVAIVGEADNGANALEQIAALRPDLVLLDLEMPNINGLEVLRRIQGSQTPPRVIIVTADKERGVDALRFGAADCLHKPVSPSRLFQSLEAIRMIVSSGESGESQQAI